MKKIPFTKYSGSGNDFALIDNTTRAYSAFQTPDVIRKLCHRHEGIGADGIIFLESDDTPLFRMRIFQPDGHEVEMCGNGLRCLGHFIHSLHPDKKHFDIATMHSVVSVSVDGNDVTIHMPEPTHIKLNQKFTVDGKEFVLHSINTGVPHAVLFVDDIEKIDVLHLGKRLRWDPVFAPEGTNVNFVKVTSPSTLEVRTFERGVEGETQACGTGVTAAALITGACYGHEGPIAVQTRSKELLTVALKPVTLSGTVRLIFSGMLHL